jgi:predicted RNase H-like nuclease (RuvC/YqgF family)
LSGTLEIEAAHRQRRIEHEQRMKDYEQEIEKLDRMILHTRNETAQIKRENERLAELKSKIDSSFSKHGINLPLTQIPEQP